MYVMLKMTNILFLCGSYTGKEVGETVLYYGCRHKNEDYLYQEELEESEKKRVLTQLNIAFSRDQEHKVSVSNTWNHLLELLKSNYCTD